MRRLLVMLLLVLGLPTSAWGQEQRSVWEPRKYIIRDVFAHGALDANTAMMIDAERMTLTFTNRWPAEDPVKFIEERAGSVTMIALPFTITSISPSNASWGMQWKGGEPITVTRLKAIDEVGKWKWIAEVTVDDASKEIWEVKIQRQALPQP